MARETIEVLYALADKSGTYSKFAGTSICSMFENTMENVRVHIFHDGSLKGQNQQKFASLGKRYGQEIIFYNVRKLAKKILQEAEGILDKAVGDNRFTEAALYRLLAPQLLPVTVQRLIYLDSDTLVNIDILKLWQEKTGSSGMGAVFERDMLAHYHCIPTKRNKELVELDAYFEKQYGVKTEEYFNSGVLLMDLNRIRTMGNFLLSGLHILAKSGIDNNFYDQNILNFYFAQDAYHLPWQYNILQHYDRDLRESRKVEGIYHYMGRTLKMDENELRDTIFYDYYIKTPWVEGKTICRIFTQMENFYLRYMEKRFAIMRQLTANLATKHMVLAASLNNEANVLKILQEPEKFTFKATYGTDVYRPAFLKPPEERKKEEEAKSEPHIERKEFPENVKYCFLGSDRKLNLNLPYDVDEYFYLFFVDDYIGLKMRLENAGLPEDRHYMNGNFLIEEIIDGGVINPNKFVEQL